MSCERLFEHPPERAAADVEMLGGLCLVLPFQLVDAQHDISRDLGERAIEVNALRRGGERFCVYGEVRQ